MYKSQDVVSEAQEPQLGGNDNAPANDWLLPFVDTQAAARALGIPESKVWNARRAHDDIRTPNDETKELCREVIWWHNQLFGYDITLADIRGRSRVGPIVAARADCMRRVREVRKWSFPVLGRWFGGLDHTTVQFHLAKKQVATGKASNPKGLSIQELRAKAEGYRWRKILRETKRSRGMAGATNEGTPNHETA